MVSSLTSYLSKPFRNAKKILTEALSGDFYKISENENFFIQCILHLKYWTFVCPLIVQKNAKNH